MPQNDAISKAVSSAKSTLDKANKSFPSPKPQATTPVAMAKPMAKPQGSMFSDPTIGPSLGAKAANIKQYSDALPKMHTGGEVPKTGDYRLKQGEEVIPAGRASEYRKVFVQRGAAGKHKYGSHPQSHEDGGNSPAPKGEEKHAQPKAHKGIADNVNS